MNTSAFENTIESALERSGVDVDLQSILQDVAIAMILITLDRRIIYVNSALCELLGYEAEECVGRHVDMLVTAQSRAETAKNHRKISEISMVRSVAERLYLHKDGAEIPVLSSAVVYVNETGAPQLVALQVMNISAQKRAEDTLAFKEERYKYAIESAQQGVWDRDMATNETYRSDIWYRMRGLDPDEGLGTQMDWSARVHPDDRAYAMRIGENRRRGIFDDAGFEYRERHQDGRWLWIHSRGSVVSWDGIGNPARIIGTDTDITDLKEAEHALEAMSSRLEMALTTSNVGVWDVAKKSGRIRWDDTMKEIYGAPDTDGTNVPPELWGTRLHPDDREMSLKNIDVAIEANVPVEWTFRILLPDGQLRHIQSIGRPYDDETGEAGFLGTNRDITREVTSAESLENAVENLEKSSEDLRQAKNSAEEKNDELEVAHARMEHNSLHDALTNLPNRRYLDETLEAFTNDGACLLHIDLDRFKQINDTLGHAAGDAMLVHAAHVLRTNVAREDFVARVGGDEFVVFINSEKSRDDLAAMAKRIIAMMSEPVDYHGHECRVGVSVGIARGQGADINTKQMLVNGDIALYLAKENGRNRYEFFTKTMQLEIISTKRRADEILTGLEQNQFVAYYQPQFDARTFEIVGVEALVRWNHPSEGVLAPFEFLKIAEDLNVVAKIDGLVLEQSMNDMARWQEAGINIPKVSVNVSARRLRDDTLLATLTKLNIPAGRLSFELLESIFLDNDDDDIVKYNIDHIKELGIGIDIDDFGTGHASIVGLLNLNPDRLKIDQQLIFPISKSRKQRELVKSIIDIGRSLGIQIVAEGVETMEHVRILQLLGCDTLQGYVFAKPMSADELIEFAPARAWLKAN